MARLFGCLRITKYYCNVKVFLGLVPLAVVANVFLYVLLFTRSKAKVIPLEDIPNYLVPVPQYMVNSSKVNYCSFVQSVFPTTLPTLEELIPKTLLSDVIEKHNIEPGGVWKPKTCVPMYKVAIIIPYRNRLHNLKDFLAYMHPFLQKQLLEYRIVVVEQTSKRSFNRAKLFNIGFTEAEKLNNYPCYIFHDVDLIPLNPNNIYACTELPRHMSANIDVFNYKLPYSDILGGAVAILKKQFIAINGFANTFFGWGGEDDDFYNRVTRNGTKICRFSPNVSQYIMLNHVKEIPSADRFYFLYSGKERYNTDGLNSLKYSVLLKEMLPLYTRLLVDL